MAAKLDNQILAVSSSYADDHPASETPLPSSSQSGSGKSDIISVERSSQEQSPAGSGSGGVVVPFTSLHEEKVIDEGSKKKKGKGKKGRLSLEKYNPAMTLENSGSVARDHLASERTYLAYVRTSLTIVSTGVALVQLFTISAATTNKAILRFSRPLGATIIVLGMLTLALGAARYFIIQLALVNGNFPVARVSPALLSFALLAIILVVFVVILVVRD